MCIRDSYNTNIVDKVMKRGNIQKDKIEPEQKNYAGSLTYIGSHTRKVIKCFNKYGVDIAIKKCETVFDKIRNKNIEKIPVLQKSGIYKLKCRNCDKVYLGETGRKFVCRLSDHKRGEGNRTCLLYTSTTTTMLLIFQVWGNKKCYSDKVNRLHKISNNIYSVKWEANKHFMPDYNLSAINRTDVKSILLNT